MARELMNVKAVAAALHVCEREVIRMAEHRILPGMYVRREWKFRSGEIWNWVEKNLHTLPDHRINNRHAQPAGDLMIEQAINPRAVRVDVCAKTKASVLRELAKLASSVDSSVDEKELVERLIEREAIGTTALEDGVAVPHPTRPLYSEGPLVAALRTSEGIIFGERGGGLTDLFFLICCPHQVEHLFYLGRLCRLLVDRSLRSDLRSCRSDMDFVSVILSAERRLCTRV